MFHDVTAAINHGCGSAYGGHYCGYIYSNVIFTVDERFYG